jgi:hypothetical protein
MSDAVNVLLHSHTVRLSAKQRQEVSNLKRQQLAERRKEDSAVVAEGGVRSVPSVSIEEGGGGNGGHEAVVESAEGGESLPAEGNEKDRAGEESVLEGRGAASGGEETAGDCTPGQEDASVAKAADVEAEGAKVGNGGVSLAVDLAPGEGKDLARKEDAALFEAMEVSAGSLHLAADGPPGKVDALPRGRSEAAIDGTAGANGACNLAANAPLRGGDVAQNEMGPRGTRGGVDLAVEEAPGEAEEGKRTVLGGEPQAGGVEPQSFLASAQPPAELDPGIAVAAPAQEDLGTEDTAAKLGVVYSSSVSAPGKGVGSLGEAQAGDRIREQGSPQLESSVRLTIQITEGAGLTNADELLAGTGVLQASPIEEAGLGIDMDIEQCNAEVPASFLPLLPPPEGSGAQTARLGSLATAKTGADSVLPAAENGLIALTQLNEGIVPVAEGAVNPLNERSSLERMEGDTAVTESPDNGSKLLPVVGSSAAETEEKKRSEGEIAHDGLQFGAGKEPVVKATVQEGGDAEAESTKSEGGGNAGVMSANQEEGAHSPRERDASATAPDWLGTKGNTGVKAVNLEQKVDHSRRGENASGTALGLSRVEGRGAGFRGLEPGKRRLQGDARLAKRAKMASDEGRETRAKRAAETKKAVDVPAKRPKLMSNKERAILERKGIAEVLTLRGTRPPTGGRLRLRKDPPGPGLARLRKPHKLKPQPGQATGTAKGILVKLKSVGGGLKPGKKRGGAKKEEEYGGAEWDIFRREDVPALRKFLLDHREEFLHFDKKVIARVRVLRVYASWEACCFYYCLWELKRALQGRIVRRCAWFVSPKFFFFGE